jgi:DNA-directed RNA polymerase subunit N (RpoN/RPB10)
MLEAIRCSCNNCIASKFALFLYLKNDLNIEINDIFDILNITKECCKLKFLTVAQYNDYI